MSNIHICDLSTKIRLGFQVYTTGYMEPFSRLLVSLFEINIWEWLKGITQPRVQNSCDQATPRKRIVMSHKGVKLCSKKKFMSCEGVKLFSEKLFMSRAGVF